MAKKTKDEILASVRELLGDNSQSDSAISLYEDITDSFEVENTNEDWKAKYEQNDKEWREKYSSRFFEPSKEQNEKIIEEPKVEENSTLSLEDLFTESED